VAFVLLLWVIDVVNYYLELGLPRFGIRPRELQGLAGILFAPLLHSGVAHLVANSLPLVVLGTTLLHLYPASARWVLPAVYLLPGIAVWLFAAGGIHIGASGLVYGFVSYIFVAGVLRRDRRAIAASLLVAFLYGALAWGVLPIEHGVSWETHLAAAIVGVVSALALRNLDIPPRRRYSWEYETDEDEERGDEEAGEAKAASRKAAGDEG
jgi:membrane associated rhomboid family serine protease